MGGKGAVTVEDRSPPDTGAETGMPGDIEGPVNDSMADPGELFGDLYRILRQQGVIGDRRLVPLVNEAGEPILEYGINYFEYDIDNNGTVDYTYDPGIQLFGLLTNTSVSPDRITGGMPVLTVIDPESENDFSDYGWYAAEIGTLPDETPVYGAARSPYPALCVQPVANYARWGDISVRTGLGGNRLPMVITYDATWNRSECSVNKLIGAPTVDPASGEMYFQVNSYFIEPCDRDSSGNPVPEDKCQWEDPVNGVVTYPDGVLWADLVEEVDFGRLNISRAPDSVLQSAFDEAVNNINSPDTIAIEIDAAGRILLTKNVYDKLRVNPDTGEPIMLGTVKKAIDSPLENIALYLKLMQDGHLVTPGDEREPIDRSGAGGIPIWKMLELEDGPADAVLRPAIDIDKIRDWGLGSLVDVDETEYYTYFECVDADGGETVCLCWDPDPVQPELEGQWVACTDVVDRKLFVVTECPEGVTCEGPFTGIMTDNGGVPGPADLHFAADFLAAAADKTGDIDIDMVVYLNSILGINMVLGTSADGTVDYEKNPVYFNYQGFTGYDRAEIFNSRGQAVTAGGAGNPSIYDGNVTVLQQADSAWLETTLPILSAQMDKNGNGEVRTIFDNIGKNADNFPNDVQASDNILGFAQLSDDDLSVIRFIHTFQVPGLR